jgi:hypothetical protein
MTTKLTLTVEESVISSAKKYAQKRGKSLSNLVENYLKSLSGNESKETKLSPKIKSMMGVITLPENYDYKKSLRSAINKKHSK